VIGTDEQILNFKNTIENENSKQPLVSDDGQINLIQITLKPGHTIIGKTIRESGLRENLKSMIVGIERNGDRMLNPDSGTQLQVDDILWIAGDRAKIRSFFKR
jgi:CPA2 family monovalent cation:H+ antiporter-2